jgi:hypothetical protein
MAGNWKTVELSAIPAAVLTSGGIIIKSLAPINKGEQSNHV